MAPPGPDSSCGPTWEERLSSRGQKGSIKSFFFFPAEYSAAQARVGCGGAISAHGSPRLPNPFFTATPSRAGRPLQRLQMDARRTQSPPVASPLDLRPLGGKPVHAAVSLAGPTASRVGQVCPPAPAAWARRPPRVPQEGFSRCGRAPCGRLLPTESTCAAPGLALLRSRRPESPLQRRRGPTPLGPGGRCCPRGPESAAGSGRADQLRSRECCLGNFSARAFTSPRSAHTPRPWGPGSGRAAGPWRAGVRHPGPTTRAASPPS